jgi:DnaJ-domain-containing protein 1
MHLKDYYQILELSASASPAEIKKAYRRLALQYHPDKNNNDKYAATQFVEIKEAYEVLTNPAKKEYYLQQRWYEQSIGKRTKQQAITPVTILQQALELEKYVSLLDVFRMDKQGLRDYILGLLSAETITQLKEFNEPTTLAEINAAILRSVKPLPHAFIPAILKKLYELTDNNPAALSQIHEFEKKSNNRHQREKYSLLFILIATAFLCILIWLAGR